jgi:hypothetical protein
VGDDGTFESDDGLASRERMLDLLAEYKTTTLQHETSVYSSPHRSKRDVG